MEGEGVEIKSPDAELKNNKDDPTSTKGSSGKKRKQREFASPVTDRPARERKSIERLIVSPDKEVKEFKIPKGAGTALKDIPNIVFKLSKRRAGDEVVQLLHKVLFGRTSKHAAKANILQFSGYVWSGNEEKEKAKVKERLERCVKESLHQISDLLDLPLSKSLKKEDGVLKVFEFLESPHKKLVEETVKEKKSKKAKKTPVKGSKKKASGKSPRKSPKGAKKTSRSKKQSSDEEDESDDVADFEDDMEDVEEEPEDKSDDDYAKESSSSKKRKRKSPKKESVLESVDEEETLPKKKKPIKELKKGKEKPIQVAKKEKKPKAKAEKLKEPSDEDLQEAICELLQNADFSKVTLKDVMKQLGQKFNTDLTNRKAHLKVLIQEEIHKLVGEGDNEGENGNNEGEIDDNGDKVNEDEQEKQEDASGGDPKADDEEEDGDENVAEGDGDEEDGDDEKPDGEDEEEDGNSVEDKAGGEDEVEDAKEEEDHDAGAEEDSTDGLMIADLTRRVFKSHHQ